MITPYSTVYNFCSRAKQNGIWEKVIKFLVKETRIKAGRSEEPSYALIDYHSNKIGYDGGEPPKRIKRHIVTDIMGNILAVDIQAANKHDTKGGIFVFEKALFYYPNIYVCCADTGYRKTFVNTFALFHNVRIDISM